MATKTTAGTLRDMARALGIPVSVSEAGDGFGNARDVTHIVTFGAGENAIRMAIVARTEDALNGGAWRYSHGNASDGQSTYKTLAEYHNAIVALVDAPKTSKTRKRSK